ncbi:hypothetical protein [Desulfosarcina cetonica]|uniref:hypothetical protein n=1 Tax=Desulfosarcina cetonica TaxID=90730 RepID=UPI001C4630D6|nr:hypothetical protein [Desulfosarcina cetonica]
MVSDIETLEKVYTAKNHTELMDAYKAWAADYETDTVGNFGYVAHVATAETLDRFLGDKKAAILDAGCGTGWWGRSWSKEVIGTSTLGLLRGDVGRGPP